jgi:peptidoglycan/xylan/chitin deacetylase (PgdA/CDA1 family)
VLSGHRHRARAQAIVITGAGHVVAQRLRRRWRRVADALAPPPLILMYHRIAEDDLDPWHLCVSPQNFAAHMELLRRTRQPMRLDDLTRELELGRCPRRAVVVTFDDGYRDNLLAALPVLEAFDVSATVFCTAGVVGGEQAFWWDQLAGLLLGPDPLPPTLALDVGGHRQCTGLHAAARYDAADRAADRSRPDDAAPASARLRFYRQVWGWLRALAESDRAHALLQIAQWSSAAGADVPRPLSREQAKALAASPLIEIGAHSVTHAALSTLSPAAQRAEIGHSKAQLEALVGRPVVSFAYPFGDQGADTAALVREAGFRSSCTTEAGAVRARTDPFQLPRIAVGDWNADTLAQALRSVP